MGDVFHSVSLTVIVLPQLCGGAAVTPVSLALGARQADS